MEENKAEKIIGDSTHQKKYRCICSPCIARRLIRSGFRVVDIKPNKDEKDRTVFIFENTKAFSVVLSEIIEDIRIESEEDYGEFGGVLLTPWEEVIAEEYNLERFGDPRLFSAL